MIENIQLRILCNCANNFVKSKIQSKDKVNEETD